MSENTAAATALPIIPTPPTRATGPGGTTGPAGPTGPSGPTGRALQSLRGLPRRDTDRAALGGVCAGIAERAGISVTVVRLVAVAAALVLGVGVGAYVLAWAVMPDATGRTHVEQALQGRGRSVVVAGLATLAALGIVSSVLPGVTPLLGLALVAGLGWWLWSLRSEERSSVR